VLEEKIMDKRPLVYSIATAAVVVVVLPLVIAISAVLASFGLELTGPPGIVGMFGAMGIPHVLMLVWTILAVGVVMALVTLLVKDEWEHA
jgi:hypothetical protein